MWIRITKSCNQGLSLYIKGELRDVSDAILDSLPPDVYEPESSPYESQVDPAVRARDLAKQTFLRLQQASILAADKLANAVKAAADKQQSLFVTQIALEKLIEAQTNCQKKIEKLENNTTRKGQATLANLTAKAETTDKEAEITRLMAERLFGEVKAAEAEVELQSIFAEDARLAADQANPDQQEQPADEPEPEQPEQSAPAVNAEPTDNVASANSGSQDADNPEGQTTASASIG